MQVKPLALYYSILRYLPENRRLLEKHFDVLEIQDPSADTDALLGSITLAFAPLGYYFAKEKMDRCPNLRIILSNTTCTPHIDVKAARERNIAVCSLAGEQEFLSTITATAEHTWGLILALLRHTPWSHAAVLSSEWNRFRFGGRAMLSRMVLGVVGLGRLGRMVANYGNAFGMKVIGYEPNSSSYTPAVLRTTSLSELAELSDVLTLHVPGGDSTRYLINTEILSHMQPGALLINTSRGDVIDEMALLDALKRGHLGGAALDVLNGEFEPGFQPVNHPLVQYAISHDNLLITPHIGGSTLDAWAETQQRVIKKAIELISMGVAN